jgi:hypothetical protein
LDQKKQNGQGADICHHDGVKSQPDHETLPGYVLTEVDGFVLVEIQERQSKQCEHEKSCQIDARNVPDADGYTGEGMDDVVHGCRLDPHPQI